MDFRTKIPLEKQKQNQINYSSKLLLMGSCFSENIGDLLNYYKLQVESNPFGILFHPKAVEHLITNSINEKFYTEKDIFFHNEQWHCFDTHSSLSSITKEGLLNSLNSAISQTRQNIRESSHIIITLGTSWFYREIESDKVVANCHKVSQKKFLKEILSTDKISQTIEAINSLIRLENKSTSIIYTVSPVRHIKDGFVENKRSKSHLLSAIHENTNPKRNTYYFPSYEIMMDELRDYRFYKEDMIHPNKTAINYIWKKFNEVWFSDKSLETMKEVDAIQKGMAHRPFNSNSEQHHLFIEKLNLKKKQLQEKFPHISF